MVGQPVDQLAEAAVAASFLGALPDQTRRRLLAGAIRLDLPAGATFYRDDDAARFAVVVRGLIRVFLTSPEGRQLTVRYARPGEVLGAPTAVGGPVDVSVQAVTEAALLMLDLEAVRAAGRTDATVAWALAEEVTRRLNEVLEAFAGSVFGSVRQRVARHLLDLAIGDQVGGRLVASISQQELADAVGSTREVVARVLHDLRAAALVDTSRKGLVLLDPDGLSRVVATGEL
ncbi:MAG TPA: Crp/Fnr family transcriptional regulator [Candidatus Limnocylindrales bacterium]|nr:Crp/Fnr family transcriptional regulator [Candidatus Limnocylindrales bacterium]